MSLEHTPEQDTYTDIVVLDTATDKQLVHRRIVFSGGCMASFFKEVEQTYTELCEFWPDKYVFSVGGHYSDL
jgi:hypothetical protein